MIRRRIRLSVLACVVVTGCAAQGSARWPNAYTLTASPAPTQGRLADHAQPFPFTLRLAAVTAPGWLSGRDMYYQLLYQNGSKITAYSRSRWVSAPPALVANIVQSALIDRQQWQAVIGPADDARTDLTLRLHLTSFQQAFSLPHRSVGILGVRATLIDERGGHVVSQREFDFRIPASSPDAQGGVEALSVATRDLAHSVAQWLAGVVSTWSASHAVSAAPDRR